jgi:hypothetical protein
MNFDLTVLSQSCYSSFLKGIKFLLVQEENYTLLDMEARTPLIVDASQRRVRSKRYRVTLCGIFFVAYVAGAFAMAKNFSNISACAGFSCTALSILLYLCFALRDPDDALQHLFKPIMYGFVLMAVGVSSFSFYWLHKALVLHQVWNGESYFSTFISFLMCAKWCVFTAYRLKRLINNDDYGTPIVVACPVTGAISVNATTSKSIE